MLFAIVVLQFGVQPTDNTKAYYYPVVQMIWLLTQEDAHALLRESHTRSVSMRWVSTHTSMVSVLF